MANLSNFAIGINLSGSVANPVNSLSFTAIAPWGSSGPCASIFEAIDKVMEGQAGTPQAGRMGLYFNAQTLNGASGSGATAYSTANALLP